MALSHKKLMAKRTKANAKRKGKTLGRPRKSPLLLHKAQELKAKGLSNYQIVRRLKVSEPTIRRWLK